MSHNGTYAGMGSRTAFSRPRPKSVVHEVKARQVAFKAKARPGN